MIICFYHSLANRLRSVGKFFVLSMLLTGSAGAASQVRLSSEATAAFRSSHPRLLLSAGEESKLQARVAQSSELSAVEREVFRLADEAVARPLPNHEVVGTLRRMLSLSRRVLGDLYAMAYTYRITGAERCLHKADSLLLRVCSFDDWNPSHFLDTGEMSMAVALGLDWLYDALPPATRLAAQRALVEKAFVPALTLDHGFYKAGGNWNSVCNAGLLYGALAAYEADSLMAQTIIDKCYATNGAALTDYNPDGTFPEGVNYWSYGTSFQAMLNAALEHLGLPLPADEASTKGFFRSPLFYRGMIGPTGLCFNYSDGAERMEASPQSAMFYFAAHTADASLLSGEMSAIRRAMHPDRLLPSVLVFAKELDLEASPPIASLSYWGHGRTPVYSARTAWGDSLAAFVAVKGGTPSASHGHNDAASFVYEARGVRWVSDLGNEPYEPIENAGLKLWDSSPDGDRWRLTRYDSEHHNTLTLGGQPHCVDGHTLLTDTLLLPDGSREAVVDYSEAFAASLARCAHRRVRLHPDGSLTLCDSIDLACPNSVSWHFITKASSACSDSALLLLTQGSERMAVIVDATVPMTPFVEPCTPRHPAENPNKGYWRVGFRSVAPVPEGSARFTIRFTAVCP